ncbi:MAG TPA: replicative DNA helicase, partial [Oscillospiraceae bacterium]|nr:replicative DNA helicase [Oscillospiraceae bacterium]
LGEVHRLHRNLLQKSLELKNTTLQSAQESLYYVGIDSFNFRQEIVSGLFAPPLPLQSSKILIKPLLYLEKNIIWSPITVFGRQRITGRDEEEGTDEFLTMKDEDIVKKELEIQQKNFRYIIEIVLKVLKRNVETTMEEIIDYIKGNSEEYILDDILFYHFFIILHQKSPLILDKESYEKEAILQEVIEILYDRYSILTVTEMRGIVCCNDRFSIRNMKISLEEKANGLQQ